uniref:Uncharacterized protein n=4 Tax=Avena sativa TaxID=4498 RepID=A0ACD5V8E3_AVESA
MLHLRSCILTHLISSPSASPIPFPLHRVLSAAAPAVSPSHSFAVEEYLVQNCGLTRPQALKASAKLTHLKSRTNPDAVLAFLAGLGLSSADAAGAVAKDPQLLCASVEKTLGPVVAGLTAHGLPQAEIASLISLGRTIFRCRSAVSNLPYYMSLFGTIESLVRFLKQSSALLGCSLEKVVKPNVAYLRECGLADCHISKMCLSTPWVLSSNRGRIQAMVACAEGLGVPPGSAMFRHMLQAVAYTTEEKFPAKVEFLKNTFRWSDAEVGIAVCRAPRVLVRSKEALQNGSKFLFSEVGLEPAYIAHRPALLNYSLQRRSRPRYYVLRYLKGNGLIDCARDYYYTVMLPEKVFVEKYIRHYKETAPRLAEDYAAACRGEVPSNFRFA